MPARPTATKTCKVANAGPHDAALPELATSPANFECGSPLVARAAPRMRGKEGRHLPPNATSRAWQCLCSYGFSDRQRDENCALAIAQSGASTARVPHYCFCFSSCPYRASALATKRNSAWTPCLPPGSKQGLASAAARRCCLRLEGRADAGRRDRTRRFAAVLTQARPRRASLRRGGCPRLVAFRPARPRRRPKTSLGSNSVSHRPSSLRGTTSLANGPGDSRGPARRAGLPPAPTRPAGRRPRHDLSPPTRITRVVSDFAILRLVWLVWLLGGSNAKLVRC